MRLFFLGLVFLIFNVALNAQKTVFGSFSASPVSSVYGNELAKNLGIGLTFKINKANSLRTGVNLLDYRTGHGGNLNIGFFILGDFIETGESAFNHRFDFLSNSIFAGWQYQLKKWSFSVDFHLAHGAMTNSRIEVVERYLSVEEPTTLSFDSKYENIWFYKMTYEVAYELKNFEKGSLNFFLKYSRDYIDQEDALVVGDYDEALVGYVNSLPEATIMSLQSFLESDNLIYEKATVFVGLQLNYFLK